MHEKAKDIKLVKGLSIKYLFYHPTIPSFLVIDCKKKNIQKVREYLDISTHSVCRKDKK